MTWISEETQIFRSHLCSIYTFFEIHSDWQLYLLATFTCLSRSRLCVATLFVYNLAFREISCLVLSARLINISEAASRTTQLTLLLCHYISKSLQLLEKLGNWKHSTDGPTQVFQPLLSYFKNCDSWYCPLTWPSDWYNLWML